MAKSHGGIPADMREAIEAFHREADGIVGAFVCKIEGPAPPLIYHYTNDAGLRGILESGKLWFTDVFNLNDPSELRHGLSPATAIISAEAAKGPREVELFSKELVAMLRGGIERMAHNFVCCFSKAGDDLGQWRAYGDNGRGYVLAFDGPALGNAFVSPGPGNMTFSVSYDEGELSRMQRQIVTDVLPLISAPRGRGMTNDAVAAYMSELSVALSVNILRAALFFKHGAYTNEQEYRFFQLFAKGPSVPDLKYRGRPYSLIRYREFDWRTPAAGSLKQIILGPAADRVRAFQFAADCVREFHLTPGIVSITQSSIPYRAS